MPAPCRFWQQGNCRNGDNCRFEHSGAAMNRNNPSGNRFAPLQNGNDSRNGGNNGYQGRSTQQPTNYSLDKDAIVTDLTSERPQWILSAYGPGRAAPAQLFGGPLREQSFEEMRLMHYAGIASGNPQLAVQEAEKVVNAAEQQMQNALRDINGAINFIIKSENEHPNRLDVVRESQQQGGLQPSSVGTSPTPNPFGQPSQPAQNNPFGAPSQPSANPFGTPSQSNGVAAPAFGTPSQQGAFGAPSAPAFGAPSQLGGGGGFGQPSALGQKPNPFGAPSAPAFGGPSQLGQKPNPFGAPSNSTSTPAAAPFSNFAGAPGSFNNPQTTASNTVAFGAPSQPVAPNSFGAFGAPSGAAVNQPSQPPPFGAPSSTPFGTPAPPKANPFSAPSQPATTNPFGQPTNSTPSQPNPFGTTPSQPTISNPFGQPSNTTQSSPFGQPPATSQSNPFGTTPATNTNPFGQPSNPAVKANPFGGTSSDTSNTHNPFNTTTPNTSPLDQPSSSSNQQNGDSGKPGRVAPTTTAPVSAGHPQISSYSARDSHGRVTMWKGRRVQYKDNEPGYLTRDGKWVRIWFPNGPPEPNKDAEVDASKYDEKIEGEYMYLRANGMFKDGVMPLMPPKLEWCTWDF